MLRGSGQLLAELCPSPPLADRRQPDAVRLEGTADMRLQILAQPHHALPRIQDEMQLVRGLAHRERVDGAARGVGTRGRADPARNAEVVPAA